VAFVCLWLEGLNNTTTSTCAGRIKPEYRHKGLFGFLRKIVQAEMKKNFPTLLYDWSLSTANEKTIKMNKEANGRLVEKRVSDQTINTLSNIGTSSLFRFKYFLLLYTN